mgnify:CR=1 FL=1|jgi:hypothetical protein
MTVDIHLKFAYTQVISVSANTPKNFDAVLKDNLGTFRAKVIRKTDNKVDVLLQGAPDRLGLELDYALWEFSTIWNDLDKQGHKVLALA